MQGRIKSFVEQFAAHTHFTLLDFPLIQSRGGSLIGGVVCCGWYDHLIDTLQIYSQIVHISHTYLLTCVIIFDPMSRVNRLMTSHTVNVFAI